MSNQAWQIASPGKLVLNDLGTLPTPGPKEILVRIHAISLNYRDTLILRNGFGWPVKDNIVLGGDAAGEIAAVGPNAGFSVGDRVVALFDLKNIYGPARSANGTLKKVYLCLQCS